MPAPAPPTPPDALPPLLDPGQQADALTTEPAGGAVAYASPTVTRSTADVLAAAAADNAAACGPEPGAGPDGAPGANPAPACLMLDVVNTHAHRRKEKRRRTATPESEYEYVPVLAQTDAELAQKAEARALLPGSFRLAPIKLVFQDLGTFARHASLLRVVQRPQLPYRWPQPGWGSTLGSWAMVGASVPLTLLAAAGAAACLPAIAGLYAFAWAAEAVQGAPVRQSRRLDDGADVPGAEREKWFFVNGISTPPNAAQISVDFLHTLTGRPVTALLNRTLGVWFDLWECLLQRDLHQATKDIRDGYRPLVEAIKNPAYDRIVLIGHSQGGIIVSAWADQLLADFGETELRKVEVYTFASAANHFSRAGRSMAGLEEDTSGPWAHVEHFANWQDFVAQFGVLSHLPPGATAQLGAQGFRRDDEPRAMYGQFAGRIFVRPNSGHNLLMHYLYPGQSILDDPVVKAHSNFAKYVGGGNLLAPKKAATAPH
ncbi:hypothetical protein Q8F55_006807 [Vanrija albida]|uniref:DUF676 domain-containing protein n=1 Tax=Vanrija albida TaxID=181172 RepID=A0ABR3PY56_9TREE